MNNLSLSIIFAFFLTGLFTLSCEKTGIQTTVSEISREQKISTRTVEDCEDCPVDYCCCSIELWNGTDVADLSLCGFSNGTYMCGTYIPPGNCSQFHGIGEDILLEDDDITRVIVCKEENGIFRIQNNTNATITIRITCHADQTIAQFKTKTLATMEVVFYSTDDGCFLTECED